MESRLLRAALVAASIGTVPAMAQSPPDVALSPPSFSETLASGDQVTRMLTVANQGGSDLTWRLTAGADALESVLSSLDAGFPSIVAAIPGQHLFTEGESGDHIEDGGANMYDGGNFLRTERGGPLVYTNGTVLESSALGPSGRYFTRKYPGLFVLAADLDDVHEFTIDGDLGANGGGSVDGTVTQYLMGGILYLGFVKRVHGAGVPSVNHMILVEERVGLAPQFSTSTNSDFHRLSGLSGTRRLYYLLYAGAGGGYIDDEAASRIMAAFLDTLGPSWLRIDPRTGTVPPGSSADVTLTFDAAGLFAGGYDSTLVVATDDPDEPSLSVPVHLQVTGVPELDVFPSLLDFGSIFVGGSATQDVAVHNTGTDTLTVGSVSFDHSDFTAGETSFTVAAGQTHPLAVTFAPGAVGPAEATLILVSDDADEPEFTVALRGTGLLAPDVGVSPASFDESLVTGETASRTLTVANAGGTTLSWRLTVTSGEASSLEDVRDGLEEGAASILEAIPGHYLFNEGEFGSSIGDGGFDMYDGGNSLSTNLGGPVLYTNGAVVNSPVFGTTGRYFTRKFPGLFVLAADLSGAAEFRIDGNLGADGSGFVDGTVLEQTVGGVRYLGFVKRVYAAGDPSVNHLIVVEERPGLEHEFPSHTDSDFHRVFDLSGSTRLYYLLYAGSGGGYINDQDTRQILAAFLATLRPPWLSVGSPQVGTLPPGGEVAIGVGFDAAAMIGGDYHAAIAVTSNDPDEPEVTVPVHLHVTGAADVDVSPLSLDFGSIFVGNTSSRTLAVRNLGTDVLHVSGVVFDHGDFAADASSFSLPVGETRTLTLTFTPATVGPAAATMTLVSDDPDEPAVVVSLQGGGLVPPEVAVSPASFSEDLFSGQSVTRTLLIENTGGSPLEFDLSLRSPAPAQTPETLAGNYSGTHLAFGISDHGEIMPFQSPPGIEHLQWGTFLSGHTVAYVAGGQDRTCYAAYADRDCLVAESYREVRNTPSTLEVEVVSRTSDSALRLLQTFTFQKATRYVVLKTSVTNLLAADVSNVVLKWVTDWDVGGDFQNAWDYDRDRNAVLAWEGSYVAVAGVEVPALMDLYGWDDYGQRPTHVDFPTGPVTLDGAGLLHFELGVVAPGASRSVAVVYAAGPDLETLRQAIDAGRGSAQWIDLEVESGTVPAGTSRSIQVTFDATGLIGGDYDAEIVVATNDPDEPELAVAAHLHVTGAPDLELTPASLDFGQVFVGGMVQRTVRVTNAGTDLLTVSAVTLDHPQFSADGAGFTLEVGASRALTVTYAPSDVGPAAGSLVFHSDDPDEPVLGVALGGLGLDAPELELSPGSFSESLVTGETVTRTLTIGNRGGSDLTFSIAVAATASGGLRPVPPSPATRPPSTAPGPAYDEGRTPASPPQVHPAPLAGPGLGSFPVLLVQAGGDPDDIRARLLQFPDITAIDVFDALGGTPTLDDLLPYRAVLVADANPFASPVALGNVLADYVDAGGGVVLTLASFVDIWSLRGRFMDEGYSPFGIGVGPLGSATLGTFDAAHPIMSGVTAVAGDVLGSAPLTPGATLVASWSNGFPFVATQSSNVAAVNVFTAVPGYWSGDVPLILHNALFWAAEVDWLSAAPLSGVVPPGQTLDVAVTFDAEGMNGGDYDAALVVTTNDPRQPEKRIPVGLHVTGAPDVEVTPPSVDFGTLFVGASAMRTVTVANRGTDLLTVSGITFDHGDFTADADSFTLAPRQTRSVHVTWSPGAPATVAATMIVASDDPDEPEAPVLLLGEAVIAPDVGVAPSSFAESLFTGETVTRTLTVENTGGSDLTFQVAVSGEPSRAVVRALLLQDTSPWGSTANQTVLQAAGIPFDIVGSSGLPAVNLSLYRHLIVASDQFTSFYEAIAADRSRIEAWVSAGGVLEFHAAGWGSVGGDASLVTLPGGMHILQHYAFENVVLLPGHSLVDGVASPITGNSASHAYFSDVPAGATAVVSDDFGRPNLVVYRFGAGTVVAGGQTFEFDFPHWGASRILQNMIPWANGRLDWLSVGTTEGTVPPGGSASVAVIFDAEGLVGGDYQAAVLVTSNDPDEPELVVPAHLRVTGAADLEVSPAGLVFDPIFVGGTATLPLTVTNAGTDVLTVSAVTLDHPSFTVDASSFTLAVGASRSLTVTFAPTAPESASATLVLASNDPDQPEVSVPLQGVGVIAPDVAVSPASFSESLFTGQTVTRTLTVENTGGSDLAFEVSLGDAPARSGTGRALLLQDNAPWSSTANQTVLQGLGIAFDVRGSASLETLDLSLYDHIVVAGDQTTHFYQVFADNRARIDAWVSAGGVLEFHAAGFGWADGDASLVTLPGGMHIVLNVVDQNVLLMPDHPLVAGVPNPMAEGAVSLASFTGVPAGASLVAADTFGAPTLVFYRYGAGHVVTAGHPLEYAFPNRLASVILINMIQWADGLQSWLVVDPPSGTVPAGGSATLSVLFDASGLIGGDYNASVVVTSNDPDEPAVAVPASLHVTGAPHLVVTPASLTFDPVFVGGTAALPLTVTNAGTDVLTVSAVTLDHPFFTADASSFTLAAGASRTLTVTFAPTAPESAGATLVLASDDPDEPEVSIPLQGVGLVAPDVAVAPASFSESLLTGQTVTRTLTVENTGGSDLTFEVSLGDAPARSGAGRTLLLQDNAPWSSTANETILEGLGIAFDLRGSASLETVNLSLYDHIVVAGDQTTHFYQVFANNRARIDAWVGAGGVLEFHAAGFGWASGNASLVTLPGGMRIEFDVDDVNLLLMPNHPLVAGVPNPMVESEVSLVSFTDVPGGASLVASGAFDRPTLVFYRYGTGHVVAAGHPLEFAFPNRLASVLLINMIQWAHGLESWVAVAPAAGSVPPGGSAILSVLFDAGGLVGGDYAASIVVTSNDPDEPAVAIPAALHVTGAPNIAVFPGSLEFGTVLVGAAATGTLQVTNGGTDTLTVSGLTFDHPDFSADAGSFSLGAGEGRTITVTYAPSAPGSVAATLLVASDDPDQSVTAVDLTGNAVAPGDIAVDPLSIEETVLPGTVTTRTLTLTNTGDTPLTFAIHSLARALGDPSLLLITAGADVTGLRQELADLAGFGAVDIFDATLATPSLAQITPYAAVVLISGLQPFDDAEALGNALADYVDGGGGVILTFSSFVAGWEVSGRFAAGYVPFTLASTLMDARSLGNHDGDHPIFLGVSSVTGFPSDVGLAPGAQLVAEWTGGLPFVATQGSRVVGANIYLASPGTWQGEVAALIRNASLWVAGRQGAWLSVVPRTGVLPGGTSATVAVHLDASQLELGVYSSPLIVESNDGDKPSLIVPLTLTVASCIPVIEFCNGTDDDCDGEVDEELGILTCGVGACLRTVEACGAGLPQVCSPGAPADEFCNGIDDDCNGVVDDQGDALCDDGDPCTSDTCQQGAGCAHQTSGACHASPRGQGFWQRLCSGPHPEGEITQTDVDCVNDTCTFAAVQSVADLCARLTPSPPGDKCEQAEAQFMALTLNHCQGRIADTAPILSTCSASSTVGQSRTEADALLCPPLRDEAACALAQCQSAEINSGIALQANSLRLRRLLDGSIRLAWAPPYGDAQIGPPDVYRVRRRTGSEAPFEDLSETTDLFYVDPEAGALPAAQYEVTPVWK